MTFEEWKAGEQWNDHCNPTAFAKAAWEAAWEAGAESVVSSKLLTDAIRLMRATGEPSGWHEKADQLEAMIRAAQEKE